MNVAVKAAMGLGKKYAMRLVGKKLKSLKLVGTLLCVALGIILGLVIVCLFAIAVMLSVKAVEKVMAKISEAKKTCPECDGADADAIEAVIE